MRSTCIILTTLVTLSGAHADDVPRLRPEPPPLEIPPPAEGRSVILCVGCDEPFDPITHEHLLKGILRNPYAAELRKALYWQDILHQFESKAHFDNCDFDGSTAYIAELLEETRDHVAYATQIKSRGDTQKSQAATMRAFFTLGQAVHAIQDFYAHTNYIELQVDHVSKVTDISLVPIWRPEGRAQIDQLQGKGLMSGYVFWGFPQNCPPEGLSHSELAKDSATTTSGKIFVKHLQNISQYRVAAYLARESSLLFLSDAFDAWPMLQEANGPHIILDFVVDRRAN